MKIFTKFTQLIQTGAHIGTVRTSSRWKTDALELYCRTNQKMGHIFDHNPDLTDRGIYAVDPCDPRIKFEQPRVIIIGAGMAGLSAAARLTEKGINNYLVLEATARPGGRIQSAWLGDVVAELGADWKPCNINTHPVFKISAMEDPPRPGVPAAEHTRGLFNSAVSSKMPFPPTVVAYYKFRQIEQEAANIYCHGGYKQHGSLINFMSLRIQQELHEFPEEQQHDAARIMFGMCHMMNARSGADTALLCADSTGCYMSMPGGEARVPLGLTATLAPMLRTIRPGLIRYCKQVSCIYWGTCPESEYRAEVVTTDGERYPCDYVIITVSIGVLQSAGACMFCPNLPFSKWDAITSLGFGYCNKIYIEYGRPFWYWQRTNLNFKFCCGELSCRPDWTSGIIAIEIVPNSKHVLCCKVIGLQAAQMECLSDKDIAESITDVMRMCTGDNIPYPVRILRSCWASNRFHLGAYSFGGCPDGSSQQSLACPLPGPTESAMPILLFAGEATIPGQFATVAGARLSGIREAERIVSLTVAMEGPPVSHEMRKAEASS